MDNASEIVLFAVCRFIYCPIKYIDMQKISHYTDSNCYIECILVLKCLVTGKLLSGSEITIYLRQI